MAESKETKSQEDGEKNPPPTLEDGLDDDEKTLTPEPSSKSKKKKKKSKLKNLLSREPHEEIPLAEVEDAISSTTLDEKKSLSNEEAMKLEMIIKKMNEMMPGGRKDMADHKFWSTQPVIKFDEMVFEEGQIDKPQPELVRKEPLQVPGSFEFVEMDINNDSDVQEVYELLSGHYVEDEDASFRFAYTASFLKWALLTPGYKKVWHVGLRATHNEKRKLCAFISGIPVTLRVRNNTFASVEINFLCIHKKLRSKRLAPVLIKEITRRCHVEGIWEAVYTAGVVLPKPVATCRYFHRPLNWMKLFETNFSPIPPGATKERMVLRNRLPDSPRLQGIRLMEEGDVATITALLRTYHKKFDLAPVYSEEEMRHWFFHEGADKDRVIWTYVVEDPSSKKITDFVSFYSLPSTVLKSPKHSHIRAAYLFHYATATPSSPKVEYQKRLHSLVQDALILAKNLGFDVFNALTLLDNSLFLDELKFGAGDGHLNYYLFNYRAMPIAGGTNAKARLDTDGSGVALVML